MNDPRLISGGSEKNKIEKVIAASLKSSIKNARATITIRLYDERATSSFLFSFFRIKAIME